MVFDTSQESTNQDGHGEKRRIVFGAAELPKEELGLDLFIPSRRRGPCLTRLWGLQGNSPGGRRRHHSSDGSLAHPKIT